MLKCPFNNVDCTSACALFIQRDDLNENVANKLVSLGAFATNGGCSLKQIALTNLRTMFEDTSSRRL